MDPTDFDRLSRALGANANRRTSFAVFVGGLLPFVDPDVAAVKNKRRAKREHDRHRHQQNDLQSEKKKKKPRPPNSTRTCSSGQQLCGGVCVSLANDPANCGTCGATCSRGQTCYGGQCTCDGETCLGCCIDGACLDGTSDFYCGVNGAICGRCFGGRTCRDGICSCSANQEFCGDKCADVRSDLANCGNCDIACGANQTCQAGQCVCDDETCTGCCDGVTCQSGASNEACGSNGRACERCDGGRTCQEGSCKCQSRQDFCDGTCVNTRSDEAHCGRCGSACEPGQTCDDGRCVCSGDLCNGCCDGKTCRVGTIDEQCGANGEVCRTCDGGRRCRNGSCVCPANQEFCNGNCKNLSIDSYNCGRCNNFCQSDETCCSGNCTNRNSDVKNCGTCGNVCPGDLVSWNSDIVCLAGHCTITCRAESYDLNNDPRDGCEVLDDQPNHTRQTALSLGNPQGCSNADIRSVNGMLYADGRIHVPPPNGWDSQIGSAPLWWKVETADDLDSGECSDYVIVNLSTAGGTDGCVRLSVITRWAFEFDKLESVVVTNNHVRFSVNIRGRSNTTWVQEMFFKVERICGGVGPISFRLEEYLTE